jgi:hypothetical protein
MKEAPIILGFLTRGVRWGGVYSASNCLSLLAYIHSRIDGEVRMEIELGIYNNNELELIALRWL